VNGSFYVGAYWPARRESIEACAARAMTCLEGIAGVDDLLASWCLKAPRRAAARRALGVDLDSVTAALAAGRNRRDDDGSVLDELGYSLAVWNGDDDDPVALSMRCGISGTYGPSNAVLLNLPARSDRAAALHELASATSMLRTLVEAWEPDWATVTTNALREAQRPQPGQPVLGWLTYLSPERGPVPALPAPSSVEPVKGGGSIVGIATASTVDGGLLGTIARELGPRLLRPAS